MIALSWYRKWVRNLQEFFDSRNIRTRGHRAPPLSLEILEDRLALTSYTVNTAVDAAVFNGANNTGSLRGVLTDLNNNAANAGVTSQISFALPQGAVITLLSSLPKINNPVTINAGNSVVFIATLSVAYAFWIRPNAAGTSIQNLSIFGFGEGIYDFAPNCTIAGNSITAVQTEQGIWVAGQTCAISNNLIMGTGTNKSGIFVDAGGNNCTITGNDISGNGSSGIDVRASQCDIIGNYTTGNVSSGVYVKGGNQNYITNNVIANNGTTGITISKGNSNYISGNLVANNGTGGVLIVGDGTANGNGNNNAIGYNLNPLVGFTDPGNTIIGNTGNGISLNGAQNTWIAGNDIGIVVVSGSSTVSSNTGHGIYVANGSRGTTIGGSNPDDGNVISGNGLDGIFVVGSATPPPQGQQNTGNTTVVGNYIGTTVDGNSKTDSFGKSTANALNGVEIVDSDQNQIGIANDFPNVIAANGQSGVSISGNPPNILVMGMPTPNTAVSMANTNSIVNNYIGVGANGTVQLPNGGIAIVGQNVRNTTVDDNQGAYKGQDIKFTNSINSTPSDNNKIRKVGLANSEPSWQFVDCDTVTITDGNVIDNGLEIDNCTNVTIQGNFIGVDENGNSTGNALAGIYVDPGSSSITVNDGNIISDNGGPGLDLAGSSITVLGNTISDNGAGGTGLSLAGVYIEASASNVTVGGAGSSNGNTIDDNAGNGIDLAGSNVAALGNTISGNGEEGAGTSLDGIYVEATASYVTLGGPGSSGTNFISYNPGNGIDIAGTEVNVAGNDIYGNVANGILFTGSSDDTVTANTIGLDPYGDADGNGLGDSDYGLCPGIDIDAGSSSITIGGPAGLGNIIADNGGNGITLAGSQVTVTGNDIYDNGTWYGLSTENNGIFVTGSSQDTITANTLVAGYDGIYIDAGSSSITIGGTLDSGNTITGGAMAGIDLFGTDIIVAGNTLSADDGFTGIYVEPGADSILIGGATADQANNLTGSATQIYSAGSNVTIAGNNIGDSETTNALYIASGSAVTINNNTVTVTNTIPDCDISEAVVVDNAGNVVIQGNTISGALSDGIFLTANADDITIGGSNAGQGNSITNNGDNGVEIAGSSVTVQGNNLSDNGVDGISVDTDADNITIGGSSAGAGNSLTDNAQHGVYLNGANVTLLGNTMSGNGLDGIDVDWAASNVALGDAAGDGNTITDNTNNGVEIAGANVTVLGNTISGNGNDGVCIDWGANQITIGGSAPGDGNTITNNGGAGIEIADTNVSVVGNTITGNNPDVLVDGGTGNSLEDNTLGFLSVTSGGITLNGSSTIGTIAVSGGTLTDAGALTVTGALNQSGGTLLVNSGSPLVLSGSVNFTGGVLSLNGGTVQTASPLSIQGGTLEGAGTIDGSVSNSGDVSLSGNGTLTITGDYTQTASGQLNVTLPQDQLLIDGAANLAGTLNVSLNSGYTPSSGDVFTVLQSSGLTGSFGSVYLPYYYGGSLSCNYGTDNVTLSAS